MKCIALLAGPLPVDKTNFYTSQWREEGAEESAEGVEMSEQN